MYPNAPTDTEKIIEIIKNNSPKTVDIIKEYMDNHDTSKMQEGVDYYFNKSDITKRKIYTYENDAKIVMRMQQTISYLPVSINYLLTRKSLILSENL